jgi:hypothetical protein
MKYSQPIGILAALLLIGACFLPWAYYPDIQKEFTGFFSEKNFYGRPGKLLMIFCTLSIILFLIPRIWAKRANILLSALIIAFSLKNYILFTACYHGICPEKRPGIFLVVLSSVAVLLASIFPDISLKENRKD